MAFFGQKNTALLNNESLADELYSLCLGDKLKLSENQLLS